LAINFAFVDEIPQEGLEWQFPPLGRYQINDCLNRGFEHKDSTDLYKGDLILQDVVIRLRNYSIERTLLWIRE
ncbi:hypothetical protein SOVF_163940, partial [Spinacia oleracea]